MGGVIFVQDCPTCARCKLQDCAGRVFREEQPHSMATLGIARH